MRLFEWTFGFEEDQKGEQFNFFFFVGQKAQLYEYYEYVYILISFRCWRTSEKNYVVGLTMSSLSLFVCDKKKTVRLLFLNAQECMEALDFTLSDLFVCSTS